MALGGRGQTGGGGWGWSPGSHLPPSTEETQPKMEDRLGSRERQCQDAVEGLLSQCYRVVMVTGKLGIGKTSFALEMIHRLRLTLEARHSLQLEETLVRCQHVTTWEDFCDVMVTSLQLHLTKQCDPHVDIVDHVRRWTEVTSHRRLVLVLSHCEALMISGLDLGRRFLDFLGQLLDVAPLLCVVMTSHVEFRLENGYRTHVVHLEPLTEPETLACLQRECPNVSAPLLRLLATACDGRSRVINAVTQRLHDVRRESDVNNNHGVNGSCDAYHASSDDHASYTMTHDDVLEAFGTPSRILCVLSSSLDPREQLDGPLRQLLRSLTPNLTLSLVAFGQFGEPVNFQTAAHVLRHRSLADLKLQTLRPLEQRHLVNIDWRQGHVTLDKFVAALLSEQRGFDSLPNVNAGLLMVRCTMGEMLQRLQRPLVEESRGRVVEYRFDDYHGLIGLVQAAISTDNPYHTVLKVLQEEEAAVLKRCCGPRALELLSRLISTAHAYGTPYERHFLSGLLANVITEVQGDKLAKAADLLRESLRWFQGQGWEAYGYQIMLFKCFLAWTEIRRGNNSDAARLLQEAERTTVPERFRQRARLLRLQIISHHAIVFVFHDRLQKAADMLHRGLAKSVHLLPDHPIVAVMLNSLGMTYEREGDYNKAFEFYQKSLSLRRRIAGENPAYLVVSLSNNAKILVQKGRYEEALPLLLEALEVRRKLNWRDYNTCLTLYFLGDAYAHAGRYEEAVSRLTEAENLALQVTPNHFVIVHVRLVLAHVLLARGKWREAMEVLDKAWRKRETMTRDVPRDQSLLHVLQLRHLVAASRSSAESLTQLQQIRAEAVAELERLVEAWRGDRNREVVKTLARLQGILVTWRSPTPPSSLHPEVQACLLCQQLQQRFPPRMAEVRQMASAIPGEHDPRTMDLPRGMVGVDADSPFWRLTPDQVGKHRRPVENKDRGSTSREQVLRNPHSSTDRRGREAAGLDHQCFLAKQNTVASNLPLLRETSVLESRHLFGSGARERRFADASGSMRPPETLSATFQYSFDPAPSCSPLLAFTDLPEWKRFACSHDDRSTSAHRHAPARETVTTSPGSKGQVYFETLHDGSDEMNCNRATADSARPGSRASAPLQKLCVPLKSSRDAEDWTSQLCTETSRNCPVSDDVDPKKPGRGAFAQQAASRGRGSLGTSVQGVEEETRREEAFRDGALRDGEMDSLECSVQAPDSANTCCPGTRASSAGASVPVSPRDPRATRCCRRSTCLAAEGIGRVPKSQPQWHQDGRVSHRTPQIAVCETGHLIRPAQRTTHSTNEGTVELIVDLYSADFSLTSASTRSSSSNEDDCDRSQLHLHLCEEALRQVKTSTGRKESSTAEQHTGSPGENGKDATTHSSTHEGGHVGRDPAKQSVTSPEANDADEGDSAKAPEATDHGKGNVCVAEPTEQIAALEVDEGHGSSVGVSATCLVSSVMGGQGSILARPLLGNPLDQLHPPGTLSSESSLTRTNTKDQAGTFDPIESARGMTPPTRAWIANHTSVANDDLVRDEAAHGHEAGKASGVAVLDEPYIGPPRSILRDRPPVCQAGHDCRAFGEDDTASPHGSDLGRSQIHEVIWDSGHNACAATREGAAAERLADDVSFVYQHSGSPREGGGEGSPAEGLASSCCASGDLLSATRGLNATALQECCAQAISDSGVFSTPNKNTEARSCQFVWDHVTEVDAVRGGAPTLQRPFLESQRTVSEARSAFSNAGKDRCQGRAADAHCQRRNSLPKNVSVSMATAGSARVQDGDKRVDLYVFDTDQCASSNSTVNYRPSRHFARLASNTEGQSDGVECHSMYSSGYSPGTTLALEQAPLPELCGSRERTPVRSKGTLRWTSDENGNTTLCDARRWDSKRNDSACFLRGRGVPRVLDHRNADCQVASKMSPGIGHCPQPWERGAVSSAAAVRLQQSRDDGVLAVDHATASGEGSRRALCGKASQTSAGVCSEEPSRKDALCQNGRERSEDSGLISLPDFAKLGL